MAEVRYPFGITVRIRRGGRDTYGNSKPQQLIQLQDCVAWPPGTSGSTESTTGFADTVTSQLVLDAPPEADIRSDDQILMPGEPDDAPGWEVSGDPSPAWQSPFTGWQPGRTVLLEKRS